MAVSASAEYLSWRVSLMPRKCRCGAVISAARLAALPHTRTCTACSAEEPVKGFMTWEHKTAPVFQVVTPKQHAWFQQHDRRSVHSNLPMGTRTISGTQSAVSRTLPVSVRLSPRTPSLPVIDMRPRARKCAHTDAPQASSYGLCVTCALEWYAVRARK